MIVTISKGLQITIPASIREELGLEVGSRVEMKKVKGKIILELIGEDLETIFAKTRNLKPKYKLTAKQMDAFNEQMFRWNLSTAI